MRVSGSFQYREERVFVWIHLKQEGAILPIVSGPVKYSLSEWKRIFREYSEVMWEELPSPSYQKQTEIGN